MKKKILSIDVPELIVPTQPVEKPKFRSARPAGDTLHERELSSTRSNLYKEEMENERKNQQIAALSKENEYLTEQINVLRSEQQQVVELLPDDELVRQNLLLLRENDYLRERVQSLEREVQELSGQTDHSVVE